MRRFIGLLLLVAAIGVVVWYGMKKRGGSPGAPAASSSGGDLRVVKGYIGGEKSGFLADAEIVKILGDKYGMRVDAAKRGSIEMVTGDVAGQDFLWPSSQFAAEVFRKRRASAGEQASSDIVFNSPLVFYSWDIIADALQRQNVVAKRGETYVLSEAPGFVRMISEGKKWKEIGVPQLYGRVTIYSTDPERSNSGTMFAALLATLLNDGDVVDDAAAEKHLPAIRQFFSRMGYMEGSSADLFKQFLNTGVGANPIIVGYENQMIEYSIEHPEQLPVLQQSVRVVYPQPTMWSSHPVIPLTDAGRKFLEAMKDPDVQRLAWERHGFRSGLAAVQNDVRGLKLGGVPPRIESVAPMPSSEVMEKILEALRANGAQPATGTPATNTSS